MKWVRFLVGGAWVILGVSLFSASVEPIPLLGVVLWFLALVVSVFVHEAGHAIGAWIVGWRVVVFAVWRVAFHVPNREFAILGKDDLKEAWGWVAAVPSAPGVNTSHRDAVVIAGGPIASLLQAIAAIAYTISFPAEGNLVGTEAAMLGFAVLGLGEFIASTVPSGAGERPNDGRMFLDWLDSSDTGEAFPAPVWADTLVHQYNVRLRDVPSWMIPEGCPPDFDEAVDYQRWRATIEIGRTLDRSPVDARLARSQFDEFWASHEPSDWLRTCDAYLAATHERDLDRAMRMLEQLDDPCTIPRMEAAARAAALKLAGNDDLAAEWLDRMDEIVAGRSRFSDFTFRDIRARIEAIEPLEEPAPALLRAQA